MSKLEVITSDKSGNVITKMNADDFMNVAKEHFGIGRNKSLPEYVTRYNEVNQETKAEIRLAK